MADDELVLSRFEGRVGDAFELLDADPPIAFELLEAAALTVRPEGSNPEHQFSLLFDGPADRPLDQQTVRLHHEELGEVALFVVPVAERDGRRHYEAVVNRSG